MSILNTAIFFQLYTVGKSARIVYIHTDIHKALLHSLNNGMVAGSKGVPFHYQHWAWSHHFTQLCIWLFILPWILCTYVVATIMPVQFLLMLTSPCYNLRSKTASQEESGYDAHTEALWKVSSITKRINLKTYVEVPDRNQILICCIFQANHQVWHAIALTFHYGRGSYALPRCSRYRMMCSYVAYEPCL